VGFPHRAAQGVPLQFVEDLVELAARAEGGAILLRLLVADSQRFHRSTVAGDRWTASLCNPYRVDACEEVHTRGIRLRRKPRAGLCNAFSVDDGDSALTPASHARHWYLHILVPRLCLGTRCVAGSACRQHFHRPVRRYSRQSLDGSAFPGRARERENRATHRGICDAFHRDAPPSPRPSPRGHRYLHKSRNANEQSKN
jgi:hypothetical protein